MPTRWYLPSSSAAPAISPTPAAEWEDVVALTRLVPSLTKTNTAPVDVTRNTAANGLGDDTLFYQFVYSLPTGTAFTTSQTFKGQVMASQTQAGKDQRSQMIARVIASNGTTVRATLYAGNPDATNGNPLNEFTTSMENREIVNVAPVSCEANYTSVAGDYLVIEVGWRKHSGGSTTGVGSFRLLDNNASDLTDGGNSGTTNGNTWFEWSGVLTTSVPASGTASAVSSAVVVSRVRRRVSSSGLPSSSASAIVQLRQRATALSTGSSSATAAGKARYRGTSTSASSASGSAAATRHSYGVGVADGVSSASAVSRRRTGGAGSADASSSSSASELLRLRSTALAGEVSAASATGRIAGGTGQFGSASSVSLASAVSSLRAQATASGESSSDASADGRARLFGSGGGATQASASAFGFIRTLEILRASGVAESLASATATRRLRGSGFAESETLASASPRVFAESNEDETGASPAILQVAVARGMIAIASSRSSSMTVRAPRT